jgi:ligand-binding sensor domain-containing protein
MWIGSNKGLYKLNTLTGSLNYYLSENSVLPDNVVLSVNEDAYGRIWVGTLGQGIAIVSSDFKLIKNINTYNGFMVLQVLVKLIIIKD